MVASTALFLAARVKTLPAALAPVGVGSILAFHHQGIFSPLIAVLSLGCALLIQLATNFFNDAIDFEKGTDTEQRLGPTRAAQAGLLSGDALYRAAFSCLIACFLLAMPFFFEFGTPMVLLCLFCLYLSYAYTGGPVPLAYRGLGELFVILFFGLLAVGGSFFLQAKELHLDSVVAGLQVGLLSSCLLAINNLRDIDEDSRSSKRTLAVRWGKKFGRWEVLCLSYGSYLLGLHWVRTGRPEVFFLPMLVLPVTTILCAKIFKTEPSRAYNGFLAMSALQLLGFSALMMVGLIWNQ